MLAHNPVFTPPDELSDLFAPACVDIFAGAGGWSTGTEQAFTDVGWRDRRIDLMINHCADAVGVHKLNHPLTEHVQCNVLEVNPHSVLVGRRIAYLHLSPDCTDHSKAKGGVPRRKDIRALADVGIVWAEARRPDVITLENVEEWRQWGPLLASGKPDKARRGEEYRRWCRELEALGYELDVRELRACDLGVPTTRKRLFVIARCDGKRIVWPEKTHGSLPSHDRRHATAGFHNGRACEAGHYRAGEAGRPIRRPNRRERNAGPDRRAMGQAERQAAVAGGEGLKPYVACGDQLEWWRPMLSIFATPAEAKTYRKRFHLRGTPRRPLQPKTMSRIAGGAFKYVLESPRPYTVNIENYGWNSPVARGVEEPLSTITAGPKGGKHALVDALLSGYSIPRYGERPGQPPRCQPIDGPAATITGTGNGTNLVAATLVRCAHGDHANGRPRWGHTSHDIERPIGAITGTNDHAVLVAHLQTLNHGGPEHRATSPMAPLPTVCSANDARGLVVGNVVKFRGKSPGTALDEPIHTITSGAGAERPAGNAHGMGISVAYLSHFYTSNTSGGQGDPRHPAKTITIGGHHSCVAATTTAPYMLAYYGQGSGMTGHTAAEPMPTIVSKARFALVTAAGGYWPLNESELERAKKVSRFLVRELGEKKMARHLVWVRESTGRKTFALVRVVIDGEPRLMTDLLLRMLYPRELANCTGFPSNYVIDRTFDGKKLSTASQVKLIGNAVPPAFARAIVRANVIDQGVLGEPPRRKRVGRKAVMS